MTDADGGASSKAGSPRVTSASVPEAFDAVAKGYDRLVGSNPGYHEHLRMSARRMGLPNEGEGLRLLDLGCGTGASTAALLSVAPKAKIVAVDASAGMLAVARAKSWPSSVRFVEGRLTTKLEVAEPAKVRGQYDAVFAAYLVRNLPSRDAGLGAIHELLKPGAPLAVHDYSVADSIRARLIWTGVSWGIIIPAGSLVTGSAALYRYLWRSVLRFDGAEEFERRLGAAGFVDQRTQTMPGWQQGIVHTWLARRPRE